jgi:ATP-dependent RNA circularization protein (DNA/RNA ligase family)
MVLLRWRSSRLVPCPIWALQEEPDLEVWFCKILFFFLFSLIGFEEGERGQSKSEKKTRKAVEKLGLKKVNGIVRVSIKKQKNIFVIVNPDVYKAGKDGFVVFGEAKIEDAQVSIF